MSINDLKEKLEELFIRFNTSPKLYLKLDFLKLLSYLKDLTNNTDTGALHEDDLKTINDQSIVGEGNIEIKGQVLTAGNALKIEDIENSDEKLISVTSHIYDEENNNCKFGRDNNVEGINSVSFGSDNEILNHPENPIEFIGYCKAPNDGAEYFYIDDEDYTLVPHGTDVDDREFHYKLLSDRSEDPGSRVEDIPDLVGSVLYADSEGAMPLGIVSKSMYAYGMHYGEYTAIIYFSLEQYPTDISRNFISVWRLIPADRSENSIVHGFSNLVCADNAHAEGKDTEASGEQSHSEGEFTVASGINSHSEGQYTTAFGNASHAEGEGEKIILFYIDSGEDLNTFNIVAGKGVSDTQITSDCASWLTGNSDSSTINTTHLSLSNPSDLIGRLTFTIGGAQLGIIQNINLELGTITFTENVTVTEYPAPVYVYSAAYGLSSHAEGFASSTVGQYSHSEGMYTQTTGEAAHAEGRRTIAYGDYSHAEGHDTWALEEAAHSEGYKTKANKRFSHAEGIKTSTHADGSHTEGFYTSASGEYSHAEGYKTETTSAGEHAHAEGEFTIAYERGSHAEGNETEAKGVFAHSEGNFTTAEGDYSHSEGRHTTAFGDSSHAEGEGGHVTLFRTYYSVYNSNIIRIYCQSSVDSDFVASDSAQNFLAGSDFFSDFDMSQSDSAGVPNVYDVEKGNKVNGWIGRPLYKADGSIIGVVTSIDQYGREITIDREVTLPGNEAIYIKTSATGEDSHAEGYLSDASGLHSHAEGERTQATGTNAHSEGFKTRAFGGNSHAEGYGTAAYTFGSHAEGKQTQVEGEYSHTEGIDTKASGNFAHGEGKSSSAQGDWSHAEGEDSQASGIGAHVEGTHCNAQGAYSHSEGYNTTTDGNTYWEDCEYEFTVTAVGENSVTVDSTPSLNINRVYKCESVPDRSTKFYLHSCEIDGDNIVPGNDGHISNLYRVIVGETYHLYKEQYTVAAHAEGKDTEAKQTAAHSEGINTRADGDAAHAEGVDSKSLSYGAHAEGINTFVNEWSEGSHTEGYETQTDSNYSHAEGWKTFVQSKEEFVNRDAKVKILSYNSTTHHIVLKLVEGYFDSLYNTFDERKQSSVLLKPIANGGDWIKLHNFIEYSSTYSTGTIELAPRYDIWGLGEKEDQSGIKGDVSYIISNYPNAIFQVRRNEYFGYGAHAEGGETFVEGTFAHAEGEHTKALKRGAHSEGFKTQAKEKYSHAEGWYTKATHKAEHAEGRCNKSNDVYMNTTVDYVDLGLPSGTLWATCNIGAINPENDGDYYAWGEIETKPEYDWSNYKWCNGTDTTITKYCEDPEYWDGEGDPDNLSQLVLEDDVALKLLLGNWKIPSKHLCEELLENTQISLQTINGVPGFLLTGPSGLSIFLPKGGYWTNNLCLETYGLSAYRIDALDVIEITNSDKADAYFIRPVSSKLKTIHSVGVGESDGDHRNALEITTDGSIFVKGVGDYDGSNPQSGKSLQQLLLQLGSQESGLAPETAIVIAAALNDLNDRINAIPQSQS